jgi:2-polyprenyl-6-methoxyphenol hydroxylase-like FAD-dependent oxidoreductase
MKIRAASLQGGRRPPVTINFDRLTGRFPFMLALSQAASERLLEEALAERGVTVERGARLVECHNEAERIVATLATAHGEEVCRPAWILAADGAHSMVRERLGIEFAGSNFGNKWDLADVALEMPLPEDRAHAFFLPGGEFQFMIRVIDPQLESNVHGPLWRIIGNRADLLNRLVTGRVIGAPVWKSRFEISHRIVRTMSTGGVYFAGDAAHLHSPIGARGMNLGIEDAWVFAQLVRRGQLARYGNLRYAVDRRVVERCPCCLTLWRAIQCFSASFAA